MIHIKEFRIGNFIQKGEKVLEVNIDILKEIEANPHHFEGISVTEYWLEKFQIPTVETAGFEYWFDFKGSWLVEVVQEGSTENNYIAQCFFVHQLQNIYFALTGEEAGEDGE